MNIVGMRQEQRRNKINQLVTIIKKVKEEKREIDNKKFLLEVMSTLGLAKRTAQEYIEVARFEAEK